MKGTLLVKNVKHLVTCDADDRLLDGVNVFIRDGVIESIGQNEETAADVIDASNMVMYPGLINTHHHLYQTFSRNLPQVQNMELFDWLKTQGIAAGVVTNKNRPRIAAILERAGISPAVLVSAQDAVPKPAPDGILLAARSLRLSPEQVLYIGDSLTDEAAARAAGCGFIALTTGATLPEEFAPDTELCENLIALRERLEQEGRA